MVKSEDPFRKRLVFKTKGADPDITEEEEDSYIEEDNSVVSNYKK